MDSLSQEQVCKPARRKRDPITGKLPSEPHVFVDGVECKMCTGPLGCGRHVPVVKFWENDQYEDGRQSTCAPCREDRRKVTGPAARTRPPRYHRKHTVISEPIIKSPALVPTKTAYVTVEGAAAVQVGWVGDAQYWPVNPLAPLCKTGLTAWNHLFVQLRDDPILRPTITPIVMVARDGKRRSMVCLPWEKWALFWERYGGDDPRVIAIREATHRAVALVFGDTAESVRAATEQMYTGSPVVTPAPAAPLSIEQAAASMLLFFRNEIRSAAKDAVCEWAGQMPQKTRDILDQGRATQTIVQQTLGLVQGAATIERVREQTVIEEWMATGWLYLAIEPVLGLMSVGMTIGKRTPEMRLNDGGYNGGKPPRHWFIAWKAQTDKPDGEEGGEQALIGYVARMDVEAITDRGLFVYDARVEADCKQLPAKIRLVDLHKLVEKMGLFPALLWQ